MYRLGRDEVEGGLRVGRGNRNSSFLKYDGAKCIPKQHNAVEITF